MHPHSLLYTLIAAALTKEGHKLDAEERKEIPTSEFAVPSKAKTPEGKAHSGSYPIEDRAHARNALARSSGKEVEAQVRAKVHAKYPDMGEK